MTRNSRSIARNFNEVMERIRRVIRPKSITPRVYQTTKYPFLLPHAHVPYKAWDLAVIESFFKTFKVETIYQHSQLIEMLKMKWLVDEFIGHYNHGRPHSFNDYLSPVKFEQVRMDQVSLIENSLGTK